MYRGQASYFVAVGAPWLLSAPRYLLVLLPVPLALAQCTRKPAAGHVLTALSALCSLGYLIAFALRSRCKPVSWLFNVIVWIIRGTPLMLQLVIIFYGPGKWFDFNLWGYFSDGRMAACVIAFVINYACYFAVIYKGGIESVPIGQQEAGQVLGMTKSQIFFKVTLLQMVKRIVPPMSNEVITLVKDTSLAKTISIMELIMTGESYMKSAGIVWPLFYTAVFYLAFVGILTLLFNYAERKLSYFR